MIYSYTTYTVNYIVHFQLYIYTYIHMIYLLSAHLKMTWIEHKAGDTSKVEGRAWERTPVGQKPASGSGWRTKMGDQRTS